MTRLKFTIWCDTLKVKVGPINNQYKLKYANKLRGKIFVLESIKNFVQCMFKVSYEYLCSKASLVWLKYIGSTRQAVE